MEILESVESLFLLTVEDPGLKSIEQCAKNTYLVDFDICILSNSDEITVKIGKAATTFVFLYGKMFQSNI